MKIDKSAEKELVKLIKKMAKEQGYNAVSNSLYKVKEDIFYCSHFVIVTRQKLVYRIGLKKISYDDLFWNIMDMPENSKQKLSLRATGAFAVPLIETASGTIEFEGDVNVISSVYCDLIKKSEETCSGWVTDVNSFVLGQLDQTYGANVLRSLAYLDRGDKEKAREIAVANIGKSGFVNEGKDYFERLAEKYK